MAGARSEARPLAASCCSVRQIWQCELALPCSSGVWLPPSTAPCWQRTAAISDELRSGCMSPAIARGAMNCSHSAKRPLARAIQRRSVKLRLCLRDDAIQSPRFIQDASTVAGSRQDQVSRGAMRQHGAVSYTAPHRPAIGSDSIVCRPRQGGTAQSVIDHNDHLPAVVHRGHARPRLSAHRFSGARPQF
jgi:hypothetical protein